MPLLLLLSCAPDAPGDSASAQAADSADTGEAPYEPLFTFAVLADPHVNGEGASAERLRTAVAWIDAEAQTRGIELVLVLGDIGWPESGLIVADEVLSELDVPWVPILGDNEVQYEGEEPFDRVFADQYAALSATFQNFRRGDTPVDNPDVGAQSWFQDLSFDHRGVHFVGLDWCSRQIGVVEGEMADLHDFAGGTWGWLEEDLAGMGDGPDRRVVFASHNPMHMSPGAFDVTELETLDALLGAYADALYASFGGHYHGNGEEADDERSIEVYVTDATWDDELTVRLVQVSGNGEAMAYAHEIVEIE